MRVPGRGWEVLVFASLLGLAGMGVRPVHAKDTEASLLAKISREKNPVKKAKHEIKLARIKLLQAMDAREKNDFEASLKLLEAYQQRISSAWETLKSSGRDAHKKPGGFKELDIELREDGRYLEDLRRSFSVMEREPVEKVIQEVERIRAEVIKALFPTMSRQTS